MMIAPEEIEPMEPLSWLAAADIAEEQGNAYAMGLYRTRARLIALARKGALKARPEFAEWLYHMNLPGYYAFVVAPEVRELTPLPITSLYMLKIPWRSVQDVRSGSPAPGCYLIRLEAGYGGGYRYVVYVHPRDIDATALEELA